MRALTLTQPWCGLVAAGIKLVENRSRRMIAATAIGRRFALHASKEIDERVYERLAEIDPALDLGLTPASELWYKLSRITSAVIGVATLDSVLDPRACGIDPDHPDAAAPLPPDQRRWFFGPIGYVLRDVIALPEPVPCRGWQGFWTLPEDVAARVGSQVARIEGDVLYRGGEQTA